MDLERRSIELNIFERKEAYASSLDVAIARLDGFEEVTDFDMDIFRLYVPDIAAFTESGHKPGETVLCTGKIKHVGSTYVDQWNYLKNQRKAPLFLRVSP